MKILSQECNVKQPLGRANIWCKVIFMNSRYSPNRNVKRNGVRVYIRASKLQSEIGQSEREGKGEFEGWKERKSNRAASNSVKEGYKLREPPTPSPKSPRAELGDSGGCKTFLQRLLTDEHCSRNSKLAYPENGKERPGTSTIFSSHPLCRAPARYLVLVPAARRRRPPTPAPSAPSAPTRRDSYPTTRNHSQPHATTRNHTHYSRSLETLQPRDLHFLYDKSDTQDALHMFLSLRIVDCYIMMRL
jgi:hypothetical protein